MSSSVWAIPFSGMEGGRGLSEPGRPRDLRTPGPPWAPRLQRPPHSFCSTWEPGFSAPPPEFTLGPRYCPSRLTSATLSSNKVIWKKHHWLPGGLPDSSFRAAGGGSFLPGDHQALSFARPIYGAVRGSGAAPIVRGAGPDPAGSSGEPDCSLIRAAGSGGKAGGPFPQSATMCGRRRVTFAGEEKWRGCASEWAPGTRHSHAGAGDPTPPGPPNPSRLLGL